MSICTKLIRTHVCRQKNTGTTVSSEYIYLVSAVNVHVRNLALSCQGLESICNAVSEISAAILLPQHTNIELILASCHCKLGKHNKQQQIFTVCVICVEQNGVQ